MSGTVPESHAESQIDPWSLSRVLGRGPTSFWDVCTQIPAMQPMLFYLRRTCSRARTPGLEIFPGSNRKQLSQYSPNRPTGRIYSTRPRWITSIRSTRSRTWNGRSALDPALHCDPLRCRPLRSLPSRRTPSGMQLSAITSDACASRNCQAPLGSPPACGARNESKGPT